MNVLGSIAAERTYRVGHLFCGLGSGAAGFNDANPRVGPLRGRFECAGGIDVDPGAIRNFERLTGARGTVMDLFDREQYVAFHGKEPPAGWLPATPAQVRAALGDRPLHTMFITAPCKGFSGLLSAAASITDKYQALNALTVRALWLTLIAYQDDPIPIILFENVPRIATRGRWLLDQIRALLRAHSYVFVDDEGAVHDCGEIGGLGQSRKRYLLIARHLGKVPPFIYQPVKHRLRGVGEIIGKLPLPGDPLAGAMHRVPRLQWRTWVRLALVPAGRDWRALNELAVQDGVLRDFGIVPSEPLRDNALGVNAWSDTAPVISSARAPGQGRFSVADPRPAEDWHNEALGVRPWEGEPARVVAGASRPHNGAHSVADPRPGYGPDTHRHVLGVNGWGDNTGTIGGSPKPSTGGYSVADPRPTQANQSYAQYGVKEWEETAATVSGQSAPGGGPYSVADPRMPGKPRFNNTFRIVAYEGASHAVAGPGGPAGGHALADPRAAENQHAGGKYRVTRLDESSGTVLAASTTGQGAFALADPRPTHGPNAHTNKMRVVDAEQPSPSVICSDRVGSGALSVADPRPVGLNAEAREGYATQGHYGVVGWDGTSRAVPGYAKYDRGNWSVADPREQQDEPLASLPEPGEQLVCRIVSLDDTWHRPFTTLELAALQSIVDPEEVFALDERTGRWGLRWEGEAFDLVGGSDATKREWIGNAVPRAAAKGMAETIGETLLLADMGETFVLSSRAIWTKPLALAMAVDPRQDVLGELL